MNPVRACVVAVLGILASLPLASSPCDFRKNSDLRFRVTAYDVAADFDDVWIATGHGVALWTRSGGELIAGPSIAVPGTTTVLARTAGGVWAGSGRAVYLIERTPTLRIASSVDTGAEINDLVAAGTWLYAATSSGVVQIDALDRNHPVVANRLNTTSGGALSVALLGQHLYAADGDRTIEVYAVATPTIPQKTGTFDSLPRSLTLQADGTNLFVSNGQQAEVFAGTGTTMTRLAALPFGASAMTAGAGPLRFVAGSDRAIRAINVLAPVPTVHATVSTPLTSGTVNRITGLATAGSLLVASAGDAGVAAWSVASFATPFPSASYEAGTAGSAWVADQRAIVALPAGGLKRYTESSGTMSPGPSWEEARAWKVRDGWSSAVLASAGATLQLFDVAASQPASIASATMSGAVIGAAMTGETKAVALLADKTAWSVDFAQPAATVAKLAVEGAPAFVAASEAGFALGELGIEETPPGEPPIAKTVIRFYPASGGASAAATIEGTSNGGIALSATGIAAAATFRGVVLADPVRGTMLVAPGTAGTPVLDLEFEGDRLLVLKAERLDVRRDADGTLASSWDLGVDAEQVQAWGGRAVVASPRGFTVIDFGHAPEVPSSVALIQDPPRLFRSIHRDGSLLWLVEPAGAEAFAVDGLGLPHSIGSIGAESSIVASAVAGGILYTLSAGGDLIGWSPGGTVVAQLAIAEAADQRMDGLHAIGGALWVSLTRGCSTGNCEKKVLVVGASSGLVVTSSLPDGVVDVVSSGQRAWVLSDTPRELRVYDISSPGAPSLAGSVALAGDPISVAHAGGSVWTLGSTLRRWSETLQPLGEFLDPWTPDPSGRVSYIDQKVREAGGCLLVAGREASPRLYDVSAGSPLAVAVPPSAGAVRGVATFGGFAHLLGETFLEGWTTGAPPGRARLIRR